MKVYTVKEVNKYIKNIIDNDYLLKKIVVQGEVSNCKYHSSGTIYFSLKDETGSLPAVMFLKQQTQGLKFKMQNGQNVIVTGRVSVFERDGKYQLYADKIQLDGVGDLHEQYELLKERLNIEGYFDFDHKKPIPKFPQRVGIVTAKTGAAIEDIKNVARRRNPYVQLILYPAKVQGDGAAETIVAGIMALDKLGVDTIIIGRGGGSIEDLWAFNEEIVVKAIYNANTPIISGTGHEVDMTLADYVADLRAPTPSAACEQAIPDVMSTVNQLKQYEFAIGNYMNSKLSLHKKNLEAYNTRLGLLSPTKKLSDQKQSLANAYDRLKKNIESKYNNALHRLEVLSVRLDGLSPTAKLINGFGFIAKDDKALLDVHDVSPGDTLDITIKSGKIKAVVSDVTDDVFG